MTNFGFYPHFGVCVSLSACSICSANFSFAAQRHSTCCSTISTEMQFHNCVSHANSLESEEKPIPLLLRFYPFNFGHAFKMDEIGPMEGDVQVVRIKIIPSFFFFFFFGIAINERKIESHCMRSDCYYYSLASFVIVFCRSVERQ